MGYVKIHIKDVASHDNLHRWEDHMLEKAKCWNQFCYGLCSENEIRAVHVEKEYNSENTYLTTLCEDCIRDSSNYGILVDEKHLMVDTHKK